MVAETGNFTRAAERRNTSQAAFSRRIKSLEPWLGFDLIDRSVYPTQQTSQGEQFREHAGELLRQMLDTRVEVGGKPVRRHEHIPDRVAVCDGDPAQLPQWWQLWSQERRLSCSVAVGNIHDIVTSLVSSNVDLMICYHHAQQPIHLDPERYERVILGTEFLWPYASQALVAKGARRCPGRTSHPAPLLMYSPGVYFARLVDLILESTPVSGPAHDRKRYGRRAVLRWRSPAVASPGCPRAPWLSCDRPQGAGGRRRRQMGAPPVNGRV